jgi:hypothetical protein
MLPLIEAHRAEIAELCRRFHVRRLDVFGSAARGTDFDPNRSDVDLLVSYTPDHRPDIGAYLELRDALADLLGRPGGPDHGERGGESVRPRRHRALPAAALWTMIRAPGCGGTFPTTQRGIGTADASCASIFRWQILGQ